MNFFLILLLFLNQCLNSNTGDVPEEVKNHYDSLKNQPETRENL